MRKNYSNNKKNSNDNNSFEFGFHLQSYGLINTLTEQTEFICFVNNVQPNSPAKHAGLNNGDVLLAIDNISLSQFKNLNEIMKHVRGNNNNKYNNYNNNKNRYNNNNIFIK